MWGRPMSENGTNKALLPANSERRVNRVEKLDYLFPKLARYGLLTAQSPAGMRFLGRSNPRGRAPNEVRSDLRKIIC